MSLCVPNVFLMSSHELHCAHSAENEESDARSTLTWVRVFREICVPHERVCVANVFLSALHINMCVCSERYVFLMRECVLLTCS